MTKIRDPTDQIISKDFKKPLKAVINQSVPIPL